MEEKDSASAAKAFKKALEANPSEETSRLANEKLKLLSVLEPPVVLPVQAAPVP